MPEEDFVNKFVIREESGHPGYHSYEIIATRASLKNLQSKLGSALARDEAIAPNKRAARGNRDGEVVMVTEYATISRGRSSRISFSLVAAEDLSRHHIRPRFSIWSWLGCLTVLGILGLAAIGLRALLLGFPL